MQSIQSVDRNTNVNIQDISHINKNSHVGNDEYDQESIQ